MVRRVTGRRPGASRHARPSRGTPRRPRDTARSPRRGRSARSPRRAPILLRESGPHLLHELGHARTHIWWNTRLHPRLGTVEIRICDAVTRIEDAAAIAAYCQALVKQLSERYDAGEEIPSYHRILTGENKWLAARYGLEAPVMDLASGRRNRIPVSRVVRHTLVEIAPHARELGSECELEGIEEILARGSSADRQLRVYGANRDIVEVARQTADATEAVPALA